MREQAIVAKTTEPLTTERLTRDPGALGVHPGMVLIVHSSLSALGWICGGTVALIDALKGAVGDTGTLVMPAQSGDLSDPANWGNPPVPEAWWPDIRAAMPAFDLERTPTRGVGIVAEHFRTHPGVLRSHHPTASFTALGPLAATITSAQRLEDPFGNHSPLGNLYDLNASVLLLGVGHDSNTTLHLAERRGLGKAQSRVQTGAPVIIGKRRTWLSFSEPDISSDDFAEVGNAFERETGKAKRGLVGHGETRLIPVRPLVDYAEVWFREHRTA